MTPAQQQKISEDQKLQAKFKKLEKKIGYTFQSTELFMQSLTHKSYKTQSNNERLEFLGDSVVNLIIGEYIFDNFQHYQEGRLSKLRASLVNEQSLEKIANHIQLGQCILLSHAEQRNHGREKPSILSDAFEALIAAVFIESGFEHTKELVIRLVKDVFQGVELEELYTDYKTLLQEYTQAKYGAPPEYQTTKEDGPEHNKTFTVCVIINKKLIATSKGRSKKRAEQNSAKKAIDILQNTNEED